MKTANIGELKNQLSGYLQYVKNGEEILPFRQGEAWGHEAQLVASGALKMPEEEMDWGQFFLAPAVNVSREIAVEVWRDSWLRRLKASWMNLPKCHATMYL